MERGVVASALEDHTRCSCMAFMGLSCGFDFHKLLRGLIRFIVDEVLRYTQVLKHVTSRHFVRYRVHAPLGERRKMNPDYLSRASHLAGMGFYAAW